MKQEIDVQPVREFQIVSKWIAEHTKFIDKYDGEELTLPLVTAEQLEQERARVFRYPHLKQDLAVNYTARWQRSNLTILVYL